MSDFAGREFYDCYEPVIVFCKWPGCYWEEMEWGADTEEAFMDHFAEVDADQTLPS